MSTCATPTSASIFPGSSAKARSKKPRACAMYSGVSPLFKQALPWKYKSIASGMQRTLRPPRLRRNELGI